MRIALELARELEPAHVRQHPIHQHQIGLTVRDGGASLATVAGGPHLVSGPAEVEGEHFTNRALVLDDQDFLLRHIHLG